MIRVIAGRRLWMLVSLLLIPLKALAPVSKLDSKWTNETDRKDCEGRGRKKRTRVGGEEEVKLPAIDPSKLDT